MSTGRGEREFYARVEALIGELRKLGLAAEAGEVEGALRGSATTSSEIPAELGFVLPAAAASVPSRTDEINELGRWARARFRMSRP